MSTTPGYGETPAGSSPEQPEWLRKAPDAPPSGSPYVVSQPEASAARTVAAFDGYGNPTGPTHAPQAPYQGAPQVSVPAQHQGYQGQSQPQPPYQAPHQGPHPGAYPPPGSPWAPVDPYAKSRLAAGLLGIFLGAFGIHRFYLGYTGVGVAMLLMTLLSFGVLGLVTSIWGLIEGILYLTDKTGRYSRDATGRRLRD